MKKIAFMFGAGAEMSYNLPSGGEFALNIFRQDSNDSKAKFRTQRDSIDRHDDYASYLPDEFWKKPIGAFRQKAYEDIIHSTVEQNRAHIIYQLSNLDDIAYSIIDKLKSDGCDVEKAFLTLNGRSIQDSYMGSTIRFHDAFNTGNNIFSSRAYSALLFAYKSMKADRSACFTEVSQIITAILQLEIGALGESFAKGINDGLFASKDDEIDIFDDFGDIIQLNYQAVGLSGLEYLLNMKKASTDSTDGIVLYFAQLLLEKIYTDVLDYKSLIDSNWMYLYQPRQEWGKFCKMVIFLLNTQSYMASLLDKVDTSIPGYYSDIRRSAENGDIDIAAIGTSNYTALAENITGYNGVVYLNGSIEMWYDPYLNRIGTYEELTDTKKHFVVPLMFTQSGTKPMISIRMSQQYVKYYESLMDSDEICIVGFGFNSDDEHINGMFRELVEHHGKALTIIDIENGESSMEAKRRIARKLRIQDSGKITVIKVDGQRQRNGILWIDAILSMTDSD